MKSTMNLHTIDENIAHTEPAPSALSALARLLGLICAALLKLLAMSWRADTKELDRVDRVLATGSPVIAVFWHGSYLPLFALAAGRPVIVFTSRSFRGKVIASICRTFGYRPKLLPPGQRGYLTMRHVLAAQNQERTNPWIVAIAIDGPLGPAGKVKSGALHLAARLGAVIMPINIASRPSWTITSRWDRFKIPLPWAKIDLKVSSPIRVPPHLGRNHEDVVKAKQQVLDSLTAGKDAAN
jgi:hypothetical protein